jgi:hypothetical protein
MSESGEGALSKWAEAHKELTDAEVRVVHWQLHNSEPVPAAMLDEVAQLRERADGLFAIATATDPGASGLVRPR